MKTTDVLISGAGIAGAAAAFWLNRAGFSVAVVERHPEPRPGGQTVDLRGAGRTVVDRMGLLEAARRISVDQAGLELVDASGRSRAKLPVDSFGGEGIVSEIEILRGDLARLLYEATLPHTEYLFDDSITGIDQHNDGVTVTFEKAPPRRCRLLIGADGSHSVVRRLAFADEPGALHPLNCYNAWFTADASAVPDLGGWLQMFNAPGGLVASARPGRLAGEIKAGLGFRSRPLEYDRRDIDSQKTLVAERFAGAGWRVPALLAELQTTPDFAMDSIDQVRLESWHRGRVVLLGDAGYCPSPLTGMGTSVALVGAYVLAGEILRSAGDHAVALDRYQQILRPYVTQAQQLPPGGVGGYAPNTRLEISLRAMSMRWMTRWPMRRLMAGQFTKAEAIDLPSYDFSAAGMVDSANGIGR